MQQASVAMIEVVDHKSIDHKGYHVEDRRPEYRDRPPHRHLEQQSSHVQFLLNAAFSRRGSIKIPKSLDSEFTSPSL